VLDWRRVDEFVDDLKGRIRHGARPGGAEDFFRIQWGTVGFGLPDGRSGGLGFADAAFGFGHDPGHGRLHNVQRLGGVLGEVRIEFLRDSLGRARSRWRWRGLWLGEAGLVFSDAFLGAGDLGDYALLFLEIDVGERGILGVGFGQGAAAAIAGAVQADRVGAQTEDQVYRDIFRHRKADRAEGGETEGDHLADQEEVHRVAGEAGPDGLKRGGVGLVESPKVGRNIGVRKVTTVWIRMSVMR
jgi:hypothetical protein